jgi:hypothetical protein
MFEAYSVAVRVTLINGVTSGLMNMSRPSPRPTATPWRSSAARQHQVQGDLAGGALAGTGLFGLHLIGKTLPYAKEYTRQLALMNTLGMKQADIAQVVADAWRTSYLVPTTTRRRTSPPSASSAAPSARTPRARRTPRRCCPSSAGSRA